MSQYDLLFLVLILISLSSLTIVVVRLLKRPERDDRGEWYEGPWDDDPKR